MANNIGDFCVETTKAMTKPLKTKNISTPNKPKLGVTYIFG
jgi:hypothetical protein